VGCVATMSRRNVFLLAYIRLNLNVPYYMYIFALRLALKGRVESVLNNYPANVENMVSS